MLRFFIHSVEVAVLPAIAVVAAIAVRLWRSGRNQPTVARRRARTLALAAAMLNFPLLIIVASENRGAGPLVEIGRVVGLLATMLFVLAFAPPKVLRSLWRRGEVEAFRRAQADLMTAATAEQVAAIVLPRAADLIGGRGAALFEGDGTLTAVHGLDREEVRDIGRRLPATPDYGAPARTVIADGFVAIALRDGWLAVTTTQAAPLFGSSEAELLLTLSRFTGLALDRAELLDRERTNALLLAQSEARLAEAQQAVMSESVLHASHDSLTLLPNRMFFLSRLNEVIRDAGSELGDAVLFLDLDRFKWVNDSLGHAAGDMILVEVSSRLRAVVRPQDTVARFGGDEFVVLCEGIHRQDEADVVAQRIASALAMPIVMADQEMTLTASIGVAFRPPGSVDSADDLVRNADLAMSQAKEQGRERIVAFDIGARHAAADRHETVTALRHAIGHDELVVHYQPEIDITTGALVAVEALVRWNHPTRGLLGPGEFIALAEESGLIVQLGAEVLRVACAQVASWQRSNRGLGDLSLSVNLAARQLMAPELTQVVEDALDHAGLDPRHLSLEITESVLLEDGDASAHALRRLKSIGVAIGVDDFGTGFSSLTYLKRFPVDILKIDRSFVAGLGHDREDRAIVASVIDLAHAFGLTTIAEGVETPGQLAELRSLGCEQGQGYLWSRPLPAADVEGWFDGYSDVQGDERAGGTSGSTAPSVVVRPKPRRCRHRVLLVDDDHPLRRLLRLIIEDDDDFEIVGETADGREAVALARHHRPDLVLLDLAMPAMGGLEALPLIRAVAPDAKVVVLSGLDGASYAASAETHGASAYVLKGTDLTDLCATLRPVLGVELPRAVRRSGQVFAPDTWKDPHRTS